MGVTGEILTHLTTDERLHFGDIDSVRAVSHSSLHIPRRLAFLVIVLLENAPGHTRPNRRIFDLLLAFAASGVWSGSVCGLILILIFYSHVMIGCSGGGE